MATDKPSKKTEEEQITRGERLAGVALLALALLTLIALLGFHHFDWPAGGHTDEIQNPLKIFGAGIAFVCVNFIFGRFGSLVFPFIIGLWGLWYLAGIGRPFIRTLKLLGWGLLTGWAIRLMILTWDLPWPNYNYGLLAGKFANGLYRFTGLTGAWILSILVLIVLVEFTMQLRTSKLSLAWIKAFKEGAMRQWLGLKAKKAHKPQPKRTSIPEHFDRKKPVPVEAVGATADDTGVETGEAEIPAPAKPEKYDFPPIELLTIGEDEGEISDEELHKAATALEQRLLEFGVEAKVVEIHPGPVINRFDLQPAPGVKVNRIVNLQDDLSLSMRARSIRILAPIPGQAAVGVEVPADKTRIVRLRTVIESDAFQESPSKLTLALGVDTSGMPYTSNLNEMPHLLVAGTTGSGKSVCLNTILASILFRAKPEEVRLALIDPKKLELSLYEPLLEHHLISAPGLKEPVVTEPDNALKLLKSLELEMQRRYILLSQRGSRNIDEYNEGRDITKLPYLVLVVDELADLMMTAGSAIESPIARLAQMGRAVGVHMILATQRPSVDVLTGVIKANFPCRIAFQVPSKVDSRTILDANGAETLLGKGDMLFLPPGVGIPTRLHGSFITSQEIEAMVEHISRQPVSEERLELPDPLTEEVRPLDLSSTERDELFEEAARLIAIHQQGSVSLLQRKLKIGYARAARLIDQMESAGIVGPFDGSKARKVLVGEDWLPDMGSSNSGIMKDEG
jgi:S-DNA-T family DNA segregation ATPase FtsK/SpoIIIE